MSHSVYHLVHLISLAILIKSSPQYTVDVNAHIKVCPGDLFCDPGSFCGTGSCLECSSAGCGIGANCKLLQAGKLECYCPDNTRGDPTVQCQSITAIDIGNRQNHLSDSLGNDNTAEGQGNSFVSNAQSSNQGFGTQGGNQRDGSQADIQRLGLQAGSQGGSTQHGSPGGTDQFNNNGVGTQVNNSTLGGGGGQVGSSPQIESSTQVVSTQGGATPGSNQVNVPGEGGSGCRISSQCGLNESCQSGRCVNPCKSVKCGEGAICQVAQRLAQCVCLENMQGNPRVQCKPKSECSLNSDCKDDKICQSGKCVDRCAFIQCGEGAKCKVSQRQAICVCADNTPVSPGEQCNYNKENVENVTQQSSTQPTTPASDSAGAVVFPVEIPEDEQRRRNGCLNTPDPGECRGAFKRFYYNQQSDQCDCFLFGGCDEEKVKFTWLTLEECQQNCLPGKKGQGQGCQRATLEEVQIFLEEEQRNRENSQN